jgi:signal transduction histidine kinase
MTGFFNALYAAGHKSFDVQIERLIAILRIVLTIFCLTVFFTSSGLHPQLTERFGLILATYALFGVGVALLPTISKYRTGWQLPVHLIDIGVVSIFTYFINSVSAAFFILYVFVLMSATYRWNWRGALWTTFALPALQLVLIKLSSQISVIQFIIEWSFLFMVGGVFAFFGVSRERSAERLDQIADWPNNKLQSYTNVDERWLDASLDHITTVLQAPRVLVLWEIAQEPYCFSAMFADGKCQHDRAMVDTSGNLVSVELENITFAIEAAKANECLTFNGIREFAGPAINDSIQTRFKLSSVCSAPFSGEYCNGRVFILDRPHWENDDLTLAEIVASRLHLELEYYALSVELRETAASRERIRLARDLHDGVLQTLTGAGLQLSSIAPSAGRDVKHKLEDIRQLLLAEQQRIRAFVEGRELSLRHPHLNLLDQTKREVESIKHRWGCHVLLSVTPQDAALPIDLTRQIELLLAEAAANAVQHGKASRLEITVEQASNNVRLNITDNGNGLSDLTGTYTHSELAARVIGPQSICRRVAELGGALTLSTSDKGVELNVELPNRDRKAQKPNEQAPAFG